MSYPPGQVTAHIRVLNLFNDFFIINSYWFYSSVIFQVLMNCLCILSDLEFSGSYIFTFWTQALYFLFFECHYNSSISQFHNKYVWKIMVKECPPQHNKTNPSSSCLFHWCTVRAHLLSLQKYAFLELTFHVKGL